MLLAIDIGNSNSLFALYENSKIIKPAAFWRCQTVQERTADEYFVWLLQLMKAAGIQGEVKRVIVSSTVPRVVFNIQVLAERYFNTQPMVVGSSQCRLGIAIRVDAHTTVGADRLVNTVAAYERFGGDLIVVDFGTATTFDVVDTDGSYIGGVIAPGVDLSVQALHKRAAALPHIDVVQPHFVIGKNTRACMQSGIFWGYISMVEGVVARIKNEYGCNMKIIATGGFAALFNRGTTLFDAVQEDLTLHGLKLIAERNH